MRLKLDENLGERGHQQLALAGHDVVTVVDQGLCGSADSRLIEVCMREQRCLVTLDLDFANPFVFPPHQYAGIVVLRLPRRPTLMDLETSTRTLLTLSRAGPLLENSGWSRGGAPP